MAVTLLRNWESRLVGFATASPWKYRVERNTGSTLRKIIPGDSPYLQAQSRGSSNKTEEPPGRAWQSVGSPQQRKNSTLTG